MKITKTRTIAVQVDVTDAPEDQQYEDALGAVSAYLGVDSSELEYRSESHDLVTNEYVWEVAA